MTASYEATLQEVAASITARKRQIEEEQVQVQTQKERLLALLQQMSVANSAFDDEDRSRVQQIVSLQDDRMLELAEELRSVEEQKQQREAVFRLMHAAIQERTRVLEADDACLAAHPEMLQFFARKQISLQKLLQAKMQACCTGQAQEQRLELGSQP